MNVTNLKIQIKNVLDEMIYNPWIAHESPKAYFQWGLFGMENSEDFDAEKRNVATSKFSTIRNITF